MPRGQCRAAQTIDPGAPYASCVAVFRRIVKWVVGLVVLSLVLVGAGAVSGLAAPLPTATLSPVQGGELTDAAKYSLPKAGASAIGFVDTDAMLASKDPDEQRAIGSIAKIVTALIVLDAKPLAKAADAPTLTMTQTDVKFHNSYESKGGAVTEVLNGLKLTQYEVLQLMLLPSANNYAATAANWAFGSLDNFGNAATTWLAKNGLHSTTITDPAGLDSATVSTPSDLLAIARLAMANPVIAEIVGQTRASIPVIGTITNTNLLLGTSGIVGIKTGTTLSAGHCLLFAVEIGSNAPGSPVVGVILGQQSRDGLNAAVKKVAAQILDSYHRVTAAKAGDTAATLTTEWGAISTLAFTEAVTARTVGKTTFSVDVAHPEVTTLVKGPGDGVATVSVTDLRGTQEFTVPLTATKEISTAPLSWQLDHALRWMPADVLPFIGWR